MTSQQIINKAAEYFLQVCDYAADRKQYGRVGVDVVFEAGKALRFELTQREVKKP